MDSILLPIHVSGEIIKGELIFKTSTDISPYPCDLFVANDLTILYISVDVTAWYFMLGKVIKGLLQIL
jgi:hypothetical protein